MKHRKSALSYRISSIGQKPTELFKIEEAKITSNKY